jgi:exodeoxyribonuclease III
MTTIYSWNVNGIRAAQKKGLLDWIQRTDPDIFCVQETKAHPDQLDAGLRSPEGYHTYWASSERPGYSGVAIYSKQQPIDVQVGLGIDRYDAEGRTLIAHYDDFTLINAYFPNGGRTNERVPFKMEYKSDFLKFCEGLRGADKRVIFCGDINTAHQDIDLARPKQNQKTTGFLPEERAWIDEVCNVGYLDIYRVLYPEQTGAYTWWAQISKGARENNVGWRIDSFFITPDLRESVVDAQIHPDVVGSDHCPISLTLR